MGDEKRIGAIIRYVGDPPSVVPKERKKRDPPILPKPGDYLSSGCAGEDVLRVLSVGKDENGCDSMDVEVFNLNDFVSAREHDNDKPSSEYGSNPLTHLELPEGVRAIFRGLQWRLAGEQYEDDDYRAIECNTPGDGCYRCTSLFTFRADSLDEHVRKLFPR